MRLVGHPESGVVPFALGAPVPREGDGRSEETLHLVAQSADWSGLSTSRQETELRHEAAERGPELQHWLFGPDGLGRDPGHQEPWVTAVRELQERVSRDRDLESAVSAHEGLGWLPAMGKSGLDEQPRHEAQRAGSLRLLGFDRERLTDQLVGRTLARDGGLRDSENSRSQSLEGGQLGEKRVRSWHQTRYPFLQLELSRLVAAGLCAGRIPERSPGIARGRLISVSRTGASSMTCCQRRPPGDRFGSILVSGRFRALFGDSHEGIVMTTIYRPIALTLLLVLVTTDVGAAGSDEEYLLRLNEKVLHAYVLENDTHPLEAIALPEMQVMTPGGLEDLARVVATVTNLEIDEMRIENHIANLSGDVAIVTGVIVWKGLMEGRPAPPKVGFMTTFVKREGEWRQLARSIIPMGLPPGAGSARPPG